MAPKISICMPTFNFERYLPEAIESVLSQEYNDYEFIIIDDCSSDGSARIIKEYAARDSRIIARFNEKNVGMVGNWNLCLQLARGEYIKFLFGDDMLASPLALSEMATLLDGNHDIALVASARNIINERSETIEVVSFYRGAKRYKGSDIVQDCLLWHKNKIGEPSAVMFRNTQIDFGFDSRYRQLVDLEMWFRILEQGEFGFIDKPLISFRVHPLQQTRQNIANFSLTADEQFMLLEDYADKAYVRLRGLRRFYLRYEPVYALWKMYKKHKKISRQTAIDMIRKRYDVRSFFVLYPFFKIYKFYLGTLYKNGHYKW